MMDARENSAGNGAKAELQPVRDEDLDEACHFLQGHLNPNLDASLWKTAFLHPWDPEKPNNGFMLRDKERIVGLFMAIYAQRTINGRPERFCNPNSWVVLPPYRSQSRITMKALLEQPDRHFFITTPNPVVTKIFKRAKFRFMCDQVTIIPCFPWTGNRWRGITVHSDATIIASALDPGAAKIFRDHRDLPWLSHLIIGRGSCFCHVIHKKRTLKKLPSAKIIHISHPGRFLELLRPLAHHFFTHLGITSLQVDSRFLGRIPMFSIQMRDPQPKMYSSPTLSDAEMGYIYSESTALDQ